MRFGTYYFFQAPPAVSHPDVIRGEIEQMAWTEELGFDSIWLTEHHFIDYGLSVSPPVLATAAAMRTRRVRLGLDGAHARAPAPRRARRGGAGARARGAGGGDPAVPRPDPARRRAGHGRHLERGPPRRGGRARQPSGRGRGGPRAADQIG